VRLPAPAIQDASIDVRRSRVYDLERSLFGPVEPEMQTRAERYALDQIVEAACTQGILEEANTRAKLAVEALLRASGGVTVTAETTSPDADGCRAPGAATPP
jgi:hypothetical protein